MTRKEAIKVCTREKAYVQSELDACSVNDGYVSPDGIITAADYVEAMSMAISALREQPRWISVEERLPECDQRVLCRYTFGDDGRMYFYQVLDYYATDPQPHFQHTLGDSKMRVTHWMPLPEAPKEEV